MPVITTGERIYLAGLNESVPIKSITTGEQIYLLRREWEWAHLNTWSGSFLGFKRKAWTQKIWELTRLRSHMHITHACSFSVGSAVQTRSTAIKLDSLWFRFVQPQLGQIYSSSLQFRFVRLQIHFSLQVRFVRLAGPGYIICRASLPTLCSVPAANYFIIMVHHFQMSAVAVSIGFHCYWVRRWWLAPSA